jgi:hypothetical protein
MLIFAKLVLRLGSWETLKVIGASYLSTFSVAVPLLGYLIFFGTLQGSTYSIDFGNLGSFEVNNSSEPNFMRLKLTYVGLSVIGITTIVFRIFCPVEISSSIDDKSYTEKFVATSYPQDIERVIEHLQQERWYDFALVKRRGINEVALVSSNTTYASVGRTSRDHPLGRNDWIDANLNHLNAVSASSYETTNYSMFVLRTSILLSYLVGFVLTMIPSIQVLCPQLLEVIAYLQKVLH